MHSLSQGDLIKVLFATLVASSCMSSSLSAPSGVSHIFKLYQKPGTFHRRTERRSLLRQGTMPLEGSVKGYGYMYTDLYLGSPPRKFSVIVDTGSSMTYVPCSDCQDCGAHEDKGFNPGRSSTAQRVACNTPQCDCGDLGCQCRAVGGRRRVLGPSTWDIWDDDGDGSDDYLATEVIDEVDDSDPGSDSSSWQEAQQQCYYHIAYLEGSSSEGQMIEDVVRFPDSQDPPRVVFGCVERETGMIHDQQADGLMGLANTHNSILSQMVTGGVMENVFGLCFGLPEGGAMLLGDVQLPPEMKVQYTRLSSTWSPYYNVPVGGMAVNGEQVSSMPSTIIIDSGTTFTYLTTPAFRSFKDRVENHARAHGLNPADGPDPNYKDWCWKGAPHNWQDLHTVFPPVTLTLGSSIDSSDITLALAPYRYLWMVQPGYYCLGIMDNGNADSILGGVSMRNMLTLFDRRTSKVGFVEADCNSLQEVLESTPAGPAPQDSPAGAKLPSPPRPPYPPRVPPVPSGRSMPPNGRVRQPPAPPDGGGGLEPNGGAADASQGRSTGSTFMVTGAVMMIIGVVMAGVLLVQQCVRNRSGRYSQLQGREGGHAGDGIDMSSFGPPARHATSSSASSALPSGAQPGQASHKHQGHSKGGGGGVAGFSGLFGGRPGKGHDQERQLLMDGDPGGMLDLDLELQDGAAAAGMQPTLPDSLFSGLDVFDGSSSTAAATAAAPLMTGSAMQAAAAPAPAVARSAGPAVGVAPVLPVSTPPVLPVLPAAVLPSSTLPASPVSTVPEPLFPAVLAPAVTSIPAPVTPPVQQQHQEQQQQPPVSIALAGSESLHAHAADPTALHTAVPAAQAPDLVSLVHAGPTAGAPLPASAHNAASDSLLP